MMVSLIYFPEMLARIKELTKWSQSDIASKFKVSQATIGRWERSTGVLRLGIEHFDKLAHICVTLGIENKCKVIS